MPTNRHALTRNRKTQQITPYAVELFRELMEIVKSGDDEVWEEDGGKRARFIELSNQLNIFELGLWVSEYGVEQVSVDQDWKPGQIGYRAWQFRRQLEEAVCRTYRLFR